MHSAHTAVQSSLFSVGQCADRSLTATSQSMPLIRISLDPEDRLPPDPRQPQPMTIATSTTLFRYLSDIVCGRLINQTDLQAACLTCGCIARCVCGIGLCINVCLFQQWIVNIVSCLRWGFWNRCDAIRPKLDNLSFSQSIAKYKLRSQSAPIKNRYDFSRVPMTTGNSQVSVGNYPAYTTTERFSKHWIISYYADIVREL